MNNIRNHGSLGWLVTLEQQFYISWQYAADGLCLIRMRLPANPSQRKTSHVWHSTRPRLGNLQYKYQLDDRRVAWTCSSNVKGDQTTPYKRTHHIWRQVAWNASHSLRRRKILSRRDGIHESRFVFKFSFSSSFSLKLNGYFALACSFPCFLFFCIRSNFCISFSGSSTIPEDAWTACVYCGLLIFSSLFVCLFQLSWLRFWAIFRFDLRCNVPFLYPAPCRPSFAPSRPITSKIVGSLSTIPVWSFFPTMSVPSAFSFLPIFSVTALICYISVWLHDPNILTSFQSTPSSY